MDSQQLSSSPPPRKDSFNGQKRFNPFMKPATGNMSWTWNAIDFPSNCADGFFMRKRIILRIYFTFLSITHIILCLFLLPSLEKSQSTTDENVKSLDNSNTTLSTDKDDRINNNDCTADLQPQQQQNQSKNDEEKTNKTNGNFYFAAMNC